MKVVLVSESFAPKNNEVAETARRIVDGLLDNLPHDDVMVVATGPGTSSYRGARVVRSRGVATANAIAGVLDPFQPDVVLTVSPKLVGAQATRHAVRRGIATITINPPALHPRASLTLASCEASLEQLTASGTGPRLWVPGTDLDAFRPDLRDEELRAAWAKDNPLVVGHVGDVRKEKVVNRLERVASMDGVRLVVFGDGPGADRLRAAGAKVTRATGGPDLARGIASLDVLVQPRKRALYVPAVRSALASGVPVVGYDSGATRDVVTHRHNGLLAHPDSGIGLRRTVRLLRNDPALRDKLAAATRESAGTRTWATATAELMGHLAQAAGKDAARLTPESLLA